MGPAEMVAEAEQAMGWSELYLSRPVGSLDDAMQSVQIWNALACRNGLAFWNRACVRSTRPMRG
jgi:hypothetical protein